MRSRDLNPLKLPRSAHLTNLVRQATPEVWVPGDYSRETRSTSETANAEPAGMDADISGLSPP